MKTRLVLVAMAISVFAISSCQKTDVTPLKKLDQTASDARNIRAGFSGDCIPMQALLITDESSNAGYMSVANSGDGFINVTYNCDSGWTLIRTDLYVGDCDLIPIALDGTPDIDNYPNITKHQNETSFTYQVPVSLIPVGTTGCISAHATIEKIGVGQAISAWGINKNITTSGADYLSFSFKYWSCE